MASDNPAWREVLSPPPRFTTICVIILSMTKLLKEAANPGQYDVIDWASEAKGLQSPMRAFFWEYLSKTMGDLKGKSVLDIGSGTGWLLEVVTKKGAKRAIGVEPSMSNFQSSQKLYPNTTTINTSFEKYSDDTKFDYITGLLSVIHIIDLGTAFIKMNNLLSKDGKILLIVSDYNYWKQPRYDYKVEIEDINPDEFVTRTTRSFGPLTSIVRKPHVYTELAQQAGLVLDSHIPMIPTKKLIKQEQKYGSMQNSPIMHLFLFKKDTRVS